MSQSDEFDLRQLLGDPGEPSAEMPQIEDVPASELRETKVISEKKLVALTQAENLAKFPGLHTNNHEKLAHQIPEPPVIAPEAMQVGAVISPLLKDDDIDVVAGVLGDDVAETLDEEYFRIFNGSQIETKDLEPEQLQVIRHRMMRVVRRVKIAMNGVRVNELGKLALITETRRKAIRVKDTEFMARKAKEQEADGTLKAPRAKSSSSALTPVEKQVKQFVKLMMSDEVIRTTLAAVGTPIPENLAELIAKHRK